MGMLMDLLTLPLMGPIKGVVWISNKIAEQAEKEMFSEEAVRGKLLELEMLYDLGTISEEDYAEAEEVLLKLLRAARERQAAESEE